MQTSENNLFIFETIEELDKMKSSEFEPDNVPLKGIISSRLKKAREKEYKGEIPMIYKSLYEMLLEYDELSRGSSMPNKQKKDFKLEFEITIEAQVNSLAKEIKDV